MKSLDIQSPSFPSELESFVTAVCELVHLNPSLSHQESFKRGLNAFLWSSKISVQTLYLIVRVTTEA